MNDCADYWIEKFNLINHHEGGFYRRIYEDDCSAIYFLLKDNNFSAFHRLRSTEIWNFYAGVPAEIYYIKQDGQLVHQKIGGDYGFQVVVPAYTWLAAKVMKNGYSLFGCTVVPKFRFEDFELAKRDNLTLIYPQHQDLIKCLTRS